MNTTPPTLDHFETALLGELREHVAARPATATRTPESPVVRPHRRRRWAAGIAAAAAAATAYVIVHRLEDADGLEAALREHGIDAEVSFDPDDQLGDFVFEGPEDELPPPAGTDTGGPVENEEGNSDGPKLSSSGDGAVTDDPIDDIGCGAGEPATLTQEGDDWVLRIPANSPLQDREVQIITIAGGALTAAYPGDQPGSYCAVASIG